MDVPALNEKDVLEGLRLLAELNNGRFPHSFTQAGMAKALAQAKNTLTKGQSIDSPVARQNVIKEFAPVIRAISFMLSKNGSDWHYSGNGAKLGDANGPILWYKRKNSELYHVIDVALSVHEADAAHLPQIASVPIGQESMR